MNTKLLAIIITAIVATAVGTGAYLATQQPTGATQDSVQDYAITKPSSSPNELNNATINAVNSTIIAGDGSTIVNPSTPPTVTPTEQPTGAPQPTATLEPTPSPIPFSATFTDDRTPSGSNSQVTITINILSGNGEQLTPDSFIIRGNFDGTVSALSTTGSRSGTSCTAISGQSLTINLTVFAPNGFTAPLVIGYNEQNIPHA